MAKRGMRKGKKIALIAAVILLVIVGISLVVYGQTVKKMKDAVEVDTIYHGVSVSGISIGGMTKEEAVNQLSAELQDSLQSEKITLTYGDKSWEWPYADFDAKYDLQGAVEEAYAIGRTGSLKERYKEVTALSEKGQTVEAHYSYNKEKVRAALAAVGTEIYQAPVDSQITRTNGKFVVTEEKEGYTLDTAKTEEKVFAALDAGMPGVIIPEVITEKPAVTKEENEQATDLLGSYETTFSSGAVGRNENLRVGCENINGTILKPGDVFSMNEALGPQTYENGYRNAAVIVDGKLEDGLGGGVCQITTTLYNAVIFAELEVVERRNHSLMVGYVPLGRDAAIAGDYLDFKFKNNTDYPVYVEAYTEGNRLVANVYGHETRPAGRTVEFEKVFIGTIAKPEEKITEDPNRPEGEREVTYTGKTGAKVSTYKKVFQNGQLVSREWFSDSTYRATADEVTVGTKKIDTAEVSAPAADGNEDTSAQPNETDMDNESEAPPLGA